MVFSFAACNKSDDPEATSNIGYSTPKPSPDELGGQVIFSTYRTAQNDNSAFNFLQEYINQYPGVEITNDNEYTYEEYFATLDQRVEDGTIGDVFLVDSDRLATYVEKGYVMNLSPYLNNLVEFTSGQFNKLIPSTDLFSAAYQDALYENRLYMIPTEYENKAVLLNLDILEKAGLTVPNDKWTWDDVLAYATALKEAGVEQPVAMDYSDFSVWGAFALGAGGELFEVVNQKTGATTLNLTDPKVVNGLKTLADDYISSGLLYEKTPDEMTGEDIRKTGIIVISHENLSEWQEVLEDETFSWEFAHFPRFAGEEEDESGKSVSSSFYYNIGVKTIGLAVRVRDYDPEEYTEADILMENEIRVQLALYALVPEAAVALAGMRGQRVPALIEANAKRFWREYPVSGKNTSVFSLYYKYDYAASLPAHMVLDAANELADDVGEAIRAYAKGETDDSLDELLQEIQNHANANW